MNRLLRAWVAVLCGCIMVALLSGQALAERRVALVVGNAQYNNPSLVLSNPKNDAEDVAAVLRTLGFEVIHKTDSRKRDLELAMAQFARMSTNADVALFFYAGHALQYQGQNYLMPVDAALEDEISLRYQMMAIDDVRAALDRASGVKIMILDACRNNPVVDVLKRRMSGTARNVENLRGLARIDKTQGMVVAYATAADDVAADGTGRNSPYTTALLKRLQEPGLEIEIMFRRIAADVNAQTNGKQRPETYVSLLNEYYLNQLDRQAWDKVKDSNDPALLGDFVRRFPSSNLAPGAQNRLQALERTAREKQAEKELAERQAARLRQEEEQRTRLAAADREHAEREAAQQRQEEEQRTRLAAAERERLEAATAQRLRDEEQQRRQAAEAERQRLEREAALKVVPAAIPQEQACKRDAEQLARLRAGQVFDEVVRFERELACERLRPQVLRLRESLAVDDKRDPAPQVQGAPRSRLAVTEPEGAERVAAQRLQEEEQRQKADAERQKLEREAALKVAPSPRVAPTLSQDQACKRDAEKLARLRASQSREDVVRLERELACEKLRPQVVRLRESLAPE
jgi:uncharacterized caspase-like protein